MYDEFSLLISPFFYCLPIELLVYKEDTGETVSFLGCILEVLGSTSLHKVLPSFISPSNTFLHITLKLGYRCFHLHPI